MTSVVAAGVAAAAALGPGAVRLGPLLGPWLVQGVPIALAVSALGVGLGTIAGGMLNACLLGGVVLGLVPMLVNAGLARFGIRLGGPLEWLQLREFAGAVQRITASYHPGSPGRTPSPWR